MCKNLCIFECNMPEIIVLKLCRFFGINTRLKIFNGGCMKNFPSFKQLFDNLDECLTGVNF